jgi:hypothetical protein
MAKVDLDLLERLEASADPAPWKAIVSKDDNGFSTSWKIYGDDQYMPGKIDIMYYRKPEHNVELIAAMRNAMPHLIKRLRDAEKVVETARFSELYAFKKIIQEYDEVVNAKV